MALLTNMGTETTLVVLALVLTALFTSGEGCAAQCGYGAECKEKGCDCISGYSGQFILTSNPSLLYCVRECQINDSSCPVNTACSKRPTGDGKFRCYCSDDAELSDTGQCQGKREPVKTAKPDSAKSPVTSVTWRSTSAHSTAGTTKSPTTSGNVGQTETETPASSTTESPTTSGNVGQTGTEAPGSTEMSTTEISTGTETSTQGQRAGENPPGDSDALKVGLAGGIGGAVFLAIVVVVVCVSFRKLKWRGYNTTTPDLNNWSGMDKTAANKSGRPYRDGADLHLPESRRTENPAYPRVVLETELSPPVQSSNDLSTPTSNANKGDGTYDVSQLYSVVKKPKKTDTTKSETFEDLYSNAKMPEEKAKQSSQAKSRTPEEPRNTNGTPKYSKAQAKNHNYHNIQPGIPGSGNSNLAHQRGEYDTPYNTRVQMDPASPSRVDDYDELKISKV